MGWFGRVSTKWIILNEQMIYKTYIHHIKQLQWSGLVEKNTDEDSRLKIGRQNIFSLFCKIVDPVMTVVSKIPNTNIYHWWILILLMRKSLLSLPVKSKLSLITVSLPLIISMGNITVHPIIWVTVHCQPIHILSKLSPVSPSDCQLSSHTC